MGTHPIFESDFDCLTEKKTTSDENYENGDNGDYESEYKEKKKKNKKDKKNKKKEKRHSSNSDDDYNVEYKDDKDGYMDSPEEEPDSGSDWESRPKKKAKEITKNFADEK